MIGSILKKLFGSRNQRLLKNYEKVAEQILELAPDYAKLSDAMLLQASLDLQAKHQQQNIKLEQLLPQAFALVREAATRKLKMRHYKVQLIGGMALFDGKVAEMRTGEGKTLVATLPAYLHALSGKGVHIVTVNDYLAHRDANWMRPVFEALGLSVGTILPKMDKDEKREAYQADITYGTNNEFGFDYLRDNMAFSLEDKMQPELNYAIVDEVDSIFIDEARTPLIISGNSQDSSELYRQIDSIIPFLEPQKDKDSAGDFLLEEKSKQAHLSEEGHTKVEKLLVNKGLLKPGESLYDVQNIGLMHHVYAGVRAHAIFKKDVDYIVQDNEVVIVDEHTGRTMPGRRWSDGLHQAVEAKERVAIQNENQTLASITFQNYFRLYNKLSGMTGTADTEAYELQQIYGVEVVVIPTNKPNKRTDYPDNIYLTLEDKFEAIIEDIKSCVGREQPVLVGTISIETSEYLSKILTKNKIKHKVLNAKYHAQEAEIIAEAGRLGAVTIATNMAGRGTDIVLGGNLEAKLRDCAASELENIKTLWQQRHDAVINSGGLHIIGTERHESRRIDNQLRGRSGRQGDPGSTRFYLSVKDNLMRIFISDNLSSILNKIGMQKGEAITSPILTRAVENAQRKVEGHNFDIRKQLLDYDNVANDQRKVIYAKRNAIVQKQDISSIIDEVFTNALSLVLNDFIPPNAMPEEWDIVGLEACLEQEFGQKIDLTKMLDNESRMHDELLKVKICEKLRAAYVEKEQMTSANNMRQLEKFIMLSVLDSHWKEHLAAMEHMRQSIHLRGYAQKDPKQEYKKEAFNMFVAMLNSIDREVVSLLLLAQIGENLDVDALDKQMSKETDELEFHHPEVTQQASPKAQPQAVQNINQPVKTVIRQEDKVGRNEACPCGSKMKYKHCHGKIKLVEAETSDTTLH